MRKKISQFAAIRHATAEHVRDRMLEDFKERITQARPGEGLEDMLERLAVAEIRVMAMGWIKFRLEALEAAEQLNREATEQGDR